MKNFKKIMLYIFFCFSLIAVVQDGTSASAQTYKKDAFTLEMLKDDDGEAYVHLPITTEQEGSIHYEGLLNSEKTEQKNPAQQFTFDKKNQLIFYKLSDSQEAVSLYFDKKQIKEQELIVSNSEQKIHYNVQITNWNESGMTEATSSKEETSSETPSVSSSESEEEKETTESSLMSEESEESTTDSSTIASSEPTKNKSNTEAKSNALQKEIAEDKKNGWVAENDKKTLLSVPLLSGNKVCYGFANPKDVFLTNIFLKDPSGKSIDYRFGINSGISRGIRFYYFEKKSEYHFLDNVALNTVAVKGNSIRGYGEFNITHNLIYSYKIVVRVTLNPDEKQGDIQKTVDIKRVDKPILDTEPMDIGFSEVTDTKLNKRDDVDVRYIGMQRGLYIENDPYKIMFKVSDEKDGSNRPDKWGAEKGAFFDWSIGIHGPLRYSNPRDFFKTHSILGGEIHGLEENNGQPGAVVKHYSDSAIALLWNKEVIKPNKNRTISYTMNLNEPKNPELSIDSALPSSIVEGEKLDKIEGSVLDEDSENIQVLYSVDDEDYHQAADIENLAKGEKIPWSLNEIDLSTYKSGRHTISFIAQDSEGNISNKISRNIHIVDKDTKYVLDTMVSNLDSSIDKTHVGDRLHYEVYIENKEEITFFKLKNELSKYLTLDESSIKIENSRDKNPQPIILENSFTYESAFGVDEDVLVSFDAVLKDNSLGQKLSTILNTANLYKRADLSKSLAKSEVAVALEGSVTNFPKPTLDGKFLGDAIIEGDDLSFEAKLANNTVNKDIEAGSWKQVQYIFPEEEGLVLENIQVLDKNGQPVAANIAEVEIAVDEEQENNQRYATVKFKKDIKPQDGYIIKVQAKATEGSSAFSEPITVHSYAYGMDKEEEEVEVDKDIQLPKVQKQESLSLENVSENADFGVIKVPGKEEYLYANQLHLDINDTRIANNDWALEVSGEISNEHNEVLESFLSANDEEQSLLEGAIFEGTGSTKLTFGEKNDTKIYLKIPASVKKGTYQGKLDWELIDAPH